uniref:Uncharacterized protein n=1 Tax=Timema bartmani TaxID=61472 RepID=A0A7R9I9R9_9NEOP|nr:unnamed protein product [Timema bartmani]
MFAGVAQGDQEGWTVRRDSMNRLMNLLEESMDPNFSEHYKSSLNDRIVEVRVESAELRNCLLTQNIHSPLILHALNLLHLVSLRPRTFTLSSSFMPSISSHPSCPQSPPLGLTQAQDIHSPLILHALNLLHSSLGLTQTQDIHSPLILHVLNLLHLVSLRPKTFTLLSSFMSSISSTLPLGVPMFREMSGFMDHVTKLATASAEISYLAGAEYVSTSMCERINSANKELQIEMDKTKKLEEQLLKVQAEFVQKMCSEEK